MEKILRLTKSPCFESYINLRNIVSSTIPNTLAWRQRSVELKLFKTLSFLLLFENALDVVHSVYKGAVGCSWPQPLLRTAVNTFDRWKIGVFTQNAEDLPRFLFMCKLFNTVNKCKVFSRLKISSLLTLKN